MTPRREKFCLEMAKPKATQIQAYRAAFNAKNMSRRAIDNEASKLMKVPEIAMRIQQLREPAAAKVQMAREEWLLEMEKLARGDVRKMYDAFGNPVEIPELGDNEAAMVEGFEFEEQFTKVKKAGGEEDAVPTGYIKKYKLTPKVKRLLEFGKVMGWYKEKSEVELGGTLADLVLGSLKHDE